MEPLLEIKNGKTKPRFKLKNFLMVNLNTDQLVVKKVSSPAYIEVIYTLHTRITSLPFPHCFICNYKNLLQ